MPRAGGREGSAGVIDGLDHHVACIFFMGNRKTEAWKEGGRPLNGERVKTLHTKKQTI